MKGMLRLAGSGILSALMLVGATSAFGQDPCADTEAQTALYTKFVAVYNDKANMASALALGKEFIEKYGACESLEAQNGFVKKEVARLDRLVKRAAMFKRYDDAVKADNPTEIVAAGKEILAIQPDDMNIVVPMALSSSYKSTKDNSYKYAADGLHYSQLALDKIKGGWTLVKVDEVDKKTPVVGVFQYTFKKDQAIDELTYAIASLNYYSKKNKTAALPLYYSLSQSSGTFKSDPRVYAPIGDHYLEGAAPIFDEIAALIKEQSATPDEKVKAELETKIKPKIGLLNGHLERAIDAYCRAYNGAKPGAYKDNLLQLVRGYYKRRYEKDADSTLCSPSTMATSFIDPLTPVTPVVDPEPAPATTAAPATAKPGAAAATKPVSAAPAKTTGAKKGTNK